MTEPTPTDQVRNTIRQSRKRMEGREIANKEIAVMLGALTEAVLLLVEVQSRVIEMEILPLTWGPFPSNNFMPCREDVG